MEEVTQSHAKQHTRTPAGQRAFPNGVCVIVRERGRGREGGRTIGKCLYWGAGWSTGAKGISGGLLVHLNVIRSQSGLVKKRNS